MRAPVGSPTVPPLAGWCSFADAQRTTLSVDDCVTWLKRHHDFLRQLHGIFTARITSEPLFELKTAFSLHAYLCAEHVSALRERVSEMREPPLGLDVVPDHALRWCLDEIQAAPTTAELVLGLYEVAVPALIQALEDYLATTNPLADAPSVRITRFCLLEMHDLAQFGQQALPALVTAEQRQAAAPWLTALQTSLQVAGSVSGRQPRQGELPAKIHSAVPYVYDPVPQRDPRFRDSYNAGVNPEAFLYDPRFVAADKVLMLFYKRLREIDVPEMMAGIIAQTPGKPWKYYRDLSRQLWDEARHSLLGEVGFVALGLDWTNIPINFTWSLNLNTQLTPQERHAVLFFIEQGLMPKTGKRYEWEVAQAAGFPLAALIQDFDWADEVLHSQLGREWYVADYGALQPALAYGDQCWSRVMSHWQTYREQGLTEHHNWWPDLYQQACHKAGREPDPQALAFAETYAQVRADLKSISASG